jgi:acetyl-CoA synthetase (ADP-forming)
LTRTLSEAASKRLLSDFDVPIPAERVVATADEAVAAARDLGLPVVVKLTGDAIAHKTERNLVRVGLASEDEVQRAATELLAARRPDDGEAALLVAPMLRGSRELIAGVHRDAQFGPCVMIGVGGILAEARPDVVFRLAPIDERDAAEMLEDLESQRLLGSVRGEPAVDRAALARVLLALSRVATTRDDVVSVDVNPLIVVDGVPMVADALVEVRDAPA